MGERLKRAKGSGLRCAGKLKGQIGRKSHSLGKRKVNIWKGSGE